MENITLEVALRDLIAEARSPDGVSGQAVRTATAAAEHAEQQIAALRRILAELDDDGITDAALEAAEATLVPPLAASPAGADAPGVL